MDMTAPIGTTPLDSPSNGLVGKPLRPRRRAPQGDRYGHLCV